jgi:hypothetical protein
VDRHDREQLGLATGLQAVVVRPAELDDLLDDGAVLVDLDRIDAAVLAGVAVLADRGVERAAQQLDPRAQDVAEPEQDRQLDAARDQLVDQLLHIDRARRGDRHHVGRRGGHGGSRRRACAGVHRRPRRDDQVALFVDAEVAASPARDVVRVVRVGEAPPAQRIVSDECLRAGHFDHALTHNSPVTQWELRGVRYPAMSLFG